MKYKEMEDALANNQNIESIKEDIKDIMIRLKNFDTEILKELYEDSEFVSKISGFKEKFHNPNNYSINKSAIKNALKFTVFGILLGILL